MTESALISSFHVVGQEVHEKKTVTALTEELQEYQQLNEFYRQGIIKIGNVSKHFVARNNDKATTATSTDARNMHEITAINLLMKDQETTTKQGSSSASSNVATLHHIDPRQSIDLVDCMVTLILENTLKKRASDASAVITTAGDVAAAAAAATLAASTNKDAKLRDAHDFLAEIVDLRHEAKEQTRAIRHLRSIIAQLTTRRGYVAVEQPEEDTEELTQDLALYQRLGAISHRMEMLKLRK